jgi:hypothetical protein
VDLRDVVGGELRLVCPLEVVCRWRYLLLRVKPCLSRSFRILIYLILVQVIDSGRSVINCRLKVKCQDMEELGGWITDLS